MTGVNHVVPLDSSQEVGLTITTADEGTEIYVVDGQMRLRANGRRRLTTTLPPALRS